MFVRRIAALLLLTVATAAMADSIDFNLRNSSAQIQYNARMGRDALGKAEFHIGGLYADPNNTLVDLGVLVKDEVGKSAPGLSVGAGLKGVIAHTSGTNESGLALGGLVSFSPPALSRMSIVGQVYFAPNITSFGDANRFVETGIRVEYEVVPNAAAYIGYRNIQFDLTNAPTNVTLDEGAFVGVRMSF